MPSTNLIHRKRLEKLAKDLSDFHILYVQAPAGYGKTVFAAQWLEAMKGPKISITLDEYDNTSYSLCNKLCCILEAFFSLRDTDAIAAFIKHPNYIKAPKEFLMRAVAALPNNTSGYLVIDDLHCIQEPALLKILLDFLKHLPEEIKICILSRNSPPELFSEVILKNKLTFIPQQQMLFDSEEILSLYKCRNICITKKQAETIHNYTEGWPIAVSALLLSSKQIPTEKTSLVWLDHLLETQVWNRWDEPSRKFMIDICMEEKIYESLCNILTGLNNSRFFLDKLILEGAFLSRQLDGTYRFHKLFQKFLQKKFLEMPEEYRIEQTRKAAEWYQSHHAFFFAVKKFAYIKDQDAIARCFDSLETMSRNDFDAEQVMLAVHETLDIEVASEYPFLYFMLAFTARNEGRIEYFKNYADLYYQNYPQIVQRNPELGHNIFFLYTMDFRYTLKDIAAMAGDGQIANNFRGVRGSATLYFPFYHRSYRDFSELLPCDIEKAVGELLLTLGPLVGKEYGMISNCIQAGLYYEQGNLTQALELALDAAAQLKADFAPETKFCTMVLLLQIYHFTNLNEQADTIRKQIQNMIEDESAYYLQANFDAVITRNCLDSGNTAAAHTWLRTRGTEIYDQIKFFDLIIHFTTVRAHLALGNFNQAIILSEKILVLCSALNRTIDMIESYLLLSIAFWKKKRGHQKKALFYIEEAIKLAYPLNCRQSFINEGAELETMLDILQKRTMRSDYAGALPSLFIKNLSISTKKSACHSPGLTAGRIEQSEHFTPRQKCVMKLMCEGYTYQMIGDALGIKFSTVRSHIELIYRKLDVSNMKDAILKIHKLHILEER